MIASERALTALAWLLTYALHSTLLLGAAWVVARRLRSARAREVLWRTALLGGVFSATVQLAIVREPSAGRFVLGEEAVATAGPSVGPDPAPALAVLPAPEPARALEEAASPAVAEVAGLPPGPARQAWAWTHWALVGWALGGAALLALLALAICGLGRRLAGRRRLLEGPLLDRLERLRRRAGLRRRVRLSIAPRLGVPLALGTLRPEICLPPRAAVDLPPEQQDAMLAHELAHLARLDPLWLGLGRVIGTLFFFQPLNRVARRRLAECSEFLCDDWAVEHTEDPVGLARCLAAVARWMVGERTPLPACAMADLRSPLGARVERLLVEGRRPETAPAWLAPLGAGLLSATALVAPGFARAGSAPEPREAGAPPASTLHTSPSVPDAPAPVAIGAGAPSAARSVAPSAAPPAVRSGGAGRLRPRASQRAALGGELQLALDGLGTELGRLETEIEGLRALADERALGGRTLARLARVDRHAADLRRKEESLRTALDAWSASTNTRAPEEDRNR